MAEVEIEEVAIVIEIVAEVKEEVEVVEEIEVGVQRISESEKKIEEVNMEVKRTMIEEKPETIVIGEGVERERPETVVEVEIEIEEAGSGIEVANEIEVESEIVAEREIGREGEEEGRQIPMVGVCTMILLINIRKKQATPWFPLDLRTLVKVQYPTRYILSIQPNKVPHDQLLI